MKFALGFIAGAVTAVIAAVYIAHQLDEADHA